MNSEIINKVQKLRTKSGITQGELGSSLGVTRQTIIAIEKGNYTPSVTLAIKIAKYFKKPVEDVFNIVK
jgi:putative transcriptional regulator